jgi:hypothetical protein
VCCAFHHAKRCERRQKTLRPKNDRSAALAAVASARKKSFTELKHDKTATIAREPANDWTIEQVSWTEQSA